MKIRCICLGLMLYSLGLPALKAQQLNDAPAKEWCY